MTDYERGYRQVYADAMNWKTQNHLEHLPGREWVGLTDEEVAELSAYVYAGDPQYVRLIETKLKERNT